MIYTYRYKCCFSYFKTQIGI